LRLKRHTQGIRDRFGITMQRTVQELNGAWWLELDEQIPHGQTGNELAFLW
jgi:DNA polymerase V